MFSRTFPGLSYVQSHVLGNSIRSVLLGWTVFCLLSCCVAAVGHVDFPQDPVATLQVPVTGPQ